MLSVLLERSCYTADWQRTEPDYALYLSATPCNDDGYTDHAHVAFTSGGTLLAIWTQARYEGARDLRVVCSRSLDGGTAWSSPELIAGDDGIPGLVSCFGFPVVSDSSRICCFYNKNVGVVNGGHYFTGILRCAYSDDDGVSW